MMQTIFDFTLPRGYLDGNGRLQQHGRMRLATALDEVETMHDPRVQTNPAYIPILLLSRVIVQLGEFTAVTPHTVGQLFAADLTYLQDLYLRLNSSEQIHLDTVCPHCQTQYQVRVAPLG